MPRLIIRHKTLYRYHRPVLLNPHRLMLRPRDGRALRVLSMDLTVDPAARVTWAEDVVGNSVAVAHFQEPSDRLVLESVAEIQLDADPWPVFDIAASAISYPFSYSDDECTDLGPLTTPQYADPEGRMRAWAVDFVYGDRTDTLALLKDVNIGITGWIGYTSRDDEGTQPPLETLDRRSGSCRDLAVLFVEAIRHLGFGARVVSGYLHDRDQSAIGSVGDGTTHAWAETYIPGAGWISFDPTNRRVGGADLIPVAVGRDIRQLVPVAGSFAGSRDAFDSMAVEVTVTEAA